MEIYQTGMIIPAIIIYFLAFLERTVFDLGPNVELVTLAMLVSSFYLSRNTSLKLTFLLLAATDLITGNSRIFIFTWSGFLLPILVIPHLIRLVKLPTIIKAAGIGGVFSLFFYLWTNFGVWLLDSWGMYPKTLPGLIHCYIMGLPFLRLQLASTLTFVPLGFMVLHYVFSNAKIGNWILSLES